MNINQVKFNKNDLSLEAIHRALIDSPEAERVESITPHSTGELGTVVVSVENDAELDAVFHKVAVLSPYGAYIIEHGIYTNGPVGWAVRGTDGCPYVKRAIEVSATVPEHLKLFAALATYLKA